MSSGEAKGKASELAGEAKGKAHEVSIPFAWVHSNVEKDKGLMTTNRLLAKRREKPMRSRASYNAMLENNEKCRAERVDTCMIKRFRNEL